MSSASKVSHSNHSGLEERLKIRNLGIEPIHVDHSVPGAYGFVINTSQGNVVHIGDFRTHGAKPERTREFVDKAEEAESIAVCY